jgi:hypothetical protein
MKQLVWNVHMEKGTFMHGKGFIKFEVAFQFFLEMFFKKKSIATSACLMYGTQYAVPRPFWLMVIVASISLLELNLCKSHLVASISQVFRWKIHVICLSILLVQSLPV